MDKLMVETQILDKIVKELKKRRIKEVSFEFVVGSCFPTALENIKTELHRQHAMGYAEGLRSNTSTSDVEVRPIDESEETSEPTPAQ